MKPILFVVCCLCLTGLAYSQPVATAEFPFKITVDEYIEKYGSIAVDEMHRSRIPASITLAQGLLESGNGNSRLALSANNHFGIKCKKDWAGESINEDDDAPQECFRKYPSATDSYKDHSDFLKTGQRYAFLFDLELSDYKGWAHGLKQAGYATNPRYAEILITTIEKNNLQRFDGLKPTAEEQQVITEEKKEETIKHTELTINQILAVVAKQDDSYTEIALTHNMRVWQIYKYNDLNKDAQIKAGDTIYLKPKNYKAPIESIVMGEEDHMQLISQRYAIKLSRLLSMNLMQEGEEAAPGETIYLQSKRKEAVRLKTMTTQIPAKDSLYDNKVYESPEKNIATSRPALPVDAYNTESKGVMDEMAFMHQVQPKETLFSISQKYNVTVEGIVTLNNLSSQAIRTGDKLVINPNQPVAKPDEGAVIPGYHTVLSGETLYAIARLYNTTVAEIKALNEMKSDTIHIGEELIVVPLNGEKPAEEKVSDNAVDGPIYHMVREKETLYSISRKYNIDQSALRKLNDMIDNTIRVGQALRIR